MSNFCFSSLLVHILVRKIIMVRAVLQQQYLDCISSTRIVGNSTAANKITRKIKLFGRCQFFCAHKTNLTW